MTFIVDRETALSQVACVETPEVGLDVVESIDRPDVTDKEIWVVNNRYYVKLLLEGSQEFDPEAGVLSLGRTEGIYHGAALDGLETARGYTKAIVTEKVTGQSAGDMIHSVDLLEENTKSAIAFNAGMAYRRLHTYNPGGFGRVDANGRAHGGWDDYVAGAVRYAQDYDDLGLGNISTKVREIADAALEHDREPVLCHGDPKSVHVIFPESLQEGVLIDFGSAQGSLPVRDTLQYPNDPDDFLPSVSFNEGVLGEGYKYDEGDLLVSLRRSVGLSMMAVRLGQGDLLYRMDKITERMLDGELVTSAEEYHEEVHA